jgi:aerobic carbon-monoxide dehydrogenase medium subunit
MKPTPFEYHRPSTVEEAVGLLAELGDEAKVLAGGQSLIPILALRLTAFEHLVDIGRIGGLAGIEQHDGRLRIGAGTTEAAVEHSAEVAEAVPLLFRATPHIGHVQIRNRGTVGGCIAHADPAGEYPAVALALDAEVEAISVRGTRSIPAAELFTGLWGTTLEADELLTAVTFPVWGSRCGAGVEELARRHGDFAIAGAVIAVQLDGDDSVARCAIGLLGLGATPLRARPAEALVVGTTAADVDPVAVARAAVDDLTAVPSDQHGSSDYRTRVGATMVARALRRAIEEANRD